MSEQPNALRLAKWLDAMPSSGYALTNQAAAELRRLHEAHEWQYKMAGERLRRIEKLEALNAELLEALKLALGALLSSAGCHDNPRSVEAIKTIREVLNSSQQPPTVEFEHPDVQIVYEILCSDESPPAGEHWEGFAARRIVEALADHTEQPLEMVAEQPAQGCDYCNNPQYAGTKCKNCGREQPAQPSKPLTDEQIDRAIAELGLNYLADAVNNRAVLRELCRKASCGIKE